MKKLVNKKKISDPLTRFSYLVGISLVIFYIIFSLFFLPGGFNSTYNLFFKPMDDLIFTLNRDRKFEQVKNDAILEQERINAQFNMEFIGKSEHFLCEVNKCTLRMIYFYAESSVNSIAAVRTGLLSSGVWKENLMRKQELDNGNRKLWIYSIANAKENKDRINLLLKIKKTPSLIKKEDKSGILNDAAVINILKRSNNITAIVMETDY